MDRKLDSANRITIPKEMLDRLDIVQGDDINIEIDSSDNIILSKINKKKTTIEILDKIRECKDGINHAKDVFSYDYNIGYKDALDWVLNIKE